MADRDASSLLRVSKTLVERVQAERRRHAWSVRQAASRGGISNTTWSLFEKDGRVTDSVRRGVAAAFEWSGDWPEELPAAPRSPVADSLDADGIDYRRVVTAAALVADRNNALLDTLDEKLDRLIELALEIRAMPVVGPHPAEQVFDVGL